MTDGYDPRFKTPVEVEQLTEDERRALAPFFTNLDSPVFGLRMDQTVAGALFSRYSRTDKSLRRVLLDEFMGEQGLAFGGIANATATDGDLLAREKAEAFYDRVLVGYGDDSVAELGGAHIALEGVSNIAAKIIEDSRIGLSPLEKSTRYVVFNRQVDGRFRYVRDPDIMASSARDAYLRAMDELFQTYSDLLKPLLAWIRERYPRPEGTDEKAWMSATRAKAFDVLRVLLPMSAQTNLGLAGNGRAFEYLLIKMRATPFRELHDLANAMQRELDILIPSFVKRAKNERGQAYTAYLRETTAALRIQERAVVNPHWTSTTPEVRLVSFDPDAEFKVVAALLYPHSYKPFDDLLAEVRRLSPERRAGILNAATEKRGNRFHHPPRGFEEAYYTFDICADIGVYRDLHRHRVLTQERQEFTTGNGYITPPEIVEAGFLDAYRRAMDAANHAHMEILAAGLKDQAQYAVPFGYRIRWRITLNLRECFHLIELRSQPQGHPNYRRIVQEMYRLIAEVHPVLASGMRFVNMESVALERLASEQRLAAKRAALGL